MSIQNRLVYACIALGALALPARASAARILFVSDSNTDSNIPAALMADGHTVTTVMNDFVDATDTNPTLVGNLNPYDAIYWSATGAGAGDTHAAATFTALNAYVASGGIVFVTGRDAIASPDDPNLIAFLGGATATDLPGAPGAIIGASNALTTGVVDIRGVTPTGGFTDKDGLNAPFAGGTVGVCFTGTSTTSAQWALRTAGPGLIAWVSNGALGPGVDASWTTTTAGGAGAYNAALRNFASNTAQILFVSDVNTDNNIPGVLRAEGYRVRVVTNDFVNATDTNPTLVGQLSQYRAVFWSATGDGFGDTHAAATFTALSTYVTGGGRVFITGYDSIASPTDPNLIAFLGGTGSVDLPAVVGPVMNVANALTMPVVDIRGVTPTGGSSDHDALTGLAVSTTNVAATGTVAGEAQWLLRTLGTGLIAFVSNGDIGPTSAAPSWTTTTAGGAGAYNAALRNFARNAIMRMPIAANGVTCTAGSECASGVCVDGVCCNAVCAGGTTDCQACSTAAGAAVSGACGVASATTTCRPSAAGGCDVAETCNGTLLTCPADTFAAAGTSCRASAGTCDVAETCAGGTAACPADVVVAAGTSCRASAGVCDVAEACDGVAGACPADVLVAAATECRAAVGTCDIAESCTGAAAGCPADVVAPAAMTCRAATGACDVAEACDGTLGTCPTDAFAANGTACADSTTCNGDETCAAGACAPAMALDCDDGDACTADSCAEPGGCENTPIAGCGDAGGTDAGGGMVDAGGGMVDAGGGMRDTGGMGTDTGPRTDTGGAGTDTGGMGVDAGGRPASGGCACAVPAASPRSGSSVLLLLGALGLVLARRRQR